MHDPKGLDFQIKVVDGTITLPKGTYNAELTQSGLILRKGKHFQAEIKAQVSVRRKAASTVIVTLGESPVTLQPLKINGYPDRLSDAVVQILSGQPTDLTPSSYEFPRFVLILAAIPLFLIAMGGMIGGAIGGGATGLNVYLARQHRWPLPFRILLILFSSLGLIALYALLLSLILPAASNPQTSYSPPPQRNTPSGTPQIDPPAPSTPETPKPAILAELTNSGTYRINSSTIANTSAIVRDDRNSLLVGCSDGTIQTLSILDLQPTWKIVAKLPSAPTSMRKLTSDYYIVITNKGHFLITPDHKLLRLEWNWECIASSTILLVATDSELLTGTVSFSAIEKAAEKSSTGLDNGHIQSLSPNFLESKEGPPLSIPWPNGLNSADITASGINLAALGFRDGTIAIKTSGEWTIERSRISPLTCIGSGNGLGFADGIVDTGLLDEKLRYRSCGTLPIERLFSFQVWTIAVNQAGQAWTFVSQDPTDPRPVFASSEYGAIRDIVPMDFAIAVVADSHVTFLSPQRFSNSLMAE